MTNTPSLKAPGIYLFSREKALQVTIPDSLLVTFHSPSSSTTGILIQGYHEHRRDFLEKLETLIEKYKALPDVDGALIQCKVFGSAEKNTPTLLTLKNWLKRHHLPVVASDLGQGFPGKVSVNCSTGQVGIQYKKEDTDPSSYFLSTGTARDRAPHQRTTWEVLVLSALPSHRTLMKQTIEELPECAGTCPEIKKTQFPSELMKKSWAALLVSDELKTNQELMDQLNKLQSLQPSLPILWVGAELPDLRLPLKLKLMPPLEPFLIPHFKKIAQHALSETHFSKTSETYNFFKRSGKR